MAASIPKRRRRPVKESPQRMFNLGPKSARWLAEIGIHNLDDLKRVGAVAAFLELKRAGMDVSVVMLYALEGAVTHTHWLEVRRERKNELLAALK